MTNTRWTSRACAVAAASAAAAVFAFGPAAPAGAEGIPFTDPNAAGTIGFCDQSGHEITSGKIGVAPYAWTAVASDAAPVGYEAPKGRASLFVYQPIENVDPENWSGKQMTAASAFSNTGHPMARATVLDPALVDFVSVFPPHWDGLVQFRMFFTAPLQTQYAGKYPAAVVRVSGDTWTLVSGGHAACGSGTSVSAETRALPAAKFSSATPRATPGLTPSSGSASSARPASPASRSGSGAAAPGSDTPHPGATSAAAAGTKPNRASGSAGWWWLLGIVAAGGGGVALRLRRRSA